MRYLFKFLEDIVLEGVLGLGSIEIESYEGRGSGYEPDFDSEVWRYGGRVRVGVG